jgi:polar amino acid transport system permease protein
MNYTFQFGEAFKEFPLLLSGAVLTMQLAFLSFWGGAIIGLAGATAKIYGGKFTRKLAGWYVTFFTNTPALLQIYFIYYGLPEFGILLPSFSSVLLGLTLNAGAYLTEIQRAGFISVRRTELEAAETLGMSLAQQLRFVIVPHIAKTIYPPLANFFILLVLGSSIAAIFTIDELTGVAINVSTANYRWLEMFIVVAAMYIVITFIASFLLAMIGRYAFRVKVNMF